MIIGLLSPLYILFHQLSLSCPDSSSRYHPFQQMSQALFASLYFVESAEKSAFQGPHIRILSRDCGPLRPGLSNSQLRGQCSYPSRQPPSYSSLPRDFVI